MDMKAVVIEKPGVVTIHTVQVPPVGDFDIRIKIKASGICGTDIHIFHGEYMGDYPIIPGHEFSGVIDEVGSKVTRLKIGDKVAVEPNIACNNCHHCFNGRPNFCENWEAIGVTRSGGMAEYTVVPEQAAFIIGDLPFTHGALVEPLSCVLHGIERLDIKLGDKILILGAGPIGILLSKVMQMQGSSEITHVDKSTSRLDIAREAGAKHTLSSIEEIPKEFFDIVIDATGVTFLMEKTIDYIRKSGTILLFGVPDKKAELKLHLFTLFEKEISLITSFTSVRNSEQAIRLLQSGKLDAASMISHILPLNSFLQGIETIEQGLDGVLKVMISPEM